VNNVHVQFILVIKFIGKYYIQIIRLRRLIWVENRFLFIYVENSTCFLLKTTYAETDFLINVEN